MNYPQDDDTFEGDFKITLELWELNEALGECDCSGDDCGMVHLNSVKIGACTFTASECAEWWGQVEIDRLTAAAQEWWEQQGMDQAARDYADACADDMRDARMEY